MAAGACSPLLLSDTGNERSVFLLQGSNRCIHLTAALARKGQSSVPQFTGRKPREALASQGQGRHPAHLCNLRMLCTEPWMLSVPGLTPWPLHVGALQLSFQFASPGPRAPSGLQGLLHHLHKKQTCWGVNVPRQQLLTNGRWEMVPKHSSSSPLGGSDGAAHFIQALGTQSGTCLLMSLS